jgi:RNA polymerase sigma factor (sigma-70 family)
MELLTLDEYEEIAVKLLKYRFGKFSKYINNDNIGDLINYLIRSDMKYDPTKGTKLSTYRFNAFKFAVKKLLRSVKKERQNKTISLNSHIKGSNPRFELINVIVRMEKPNNEETVNVSDIITKNKLTDKQKVYMLGYFVDGKTLAQIGHENNVTRKAVSNVVINGIKRLRKIYNVENKQRPIS